MVRKLVGAAVVSGALVLGTAGTALAATPGAGGGATAGSTPGAPSCSLAPEALARLQRVDGRITTALTKVRAAEQRAGQSGQTKFAARLGRRQSRLERRQAHVEARISRIEQRCPGAAPATQTPAGGATSSSAA